MTALPNWLTRALAIAPLVRAWANVLGPVPKEQRRNRAREALERARAQMGLVSDVEPRKE